MVGVDADLVLLQVEGILAGLDGTQLVVTVQVWPSPQAAVDDVRETLPVGHLQAAVQGPAGEQTGSGGERGGVMGRRGLLGGGRSPGLVRVAVEA